ncbi:MAG: DUF726 domain-containing protein [Halobacteria archaeon]|nr:DUF726 domain-containing protein [Halobacteria archaeon]
MSGKARDIGNESRNQPQPRNRRGFEIATDRFESMVTGAIVSSRFEPLFHEEVPEDFPRVTTRGHFDVRSGVRSLTAFLDSSRPVETFLRENNTFEETNVSDEYDTEGEIPGFDTRESPDEIMVYVHGMIADRRAGLGRFSSMEYVLRENGYDHPVVGYTWDADHALRTWWPGNEIAEQNGTKLAEFVLDYKRENLDTDIRLICVSMGARVVLEAIRELAERGEYDAIESVSVLGGVVRNDAVTLDGGYGTSIKRVVGEFHNYWMETDYTLRTFFPRIEGGTALGAAGADGETPSNYHDHRVEYVPNHYSYFRPGKGCIPDVVADLTRRRVSRRP